MQIINGKSGWLEVICGPMFSGKSEELIKRLRRAQIARRRVQIFKHGIDARYDATSIVSHSQQSLPASPSPIADILDLVDDPYRTGGHRRGPVLFRGYHRGDQQAGQPGQARDRGGPGPGLHGPALRPHAPADVLCGIRVQAAGHLHDLRRSRQLHPAADRLEPTRSSSAQPRPTRHLYRRRHSRTGRGELPIAKGRDASRAKG